MGTAEENKIAQYRLYLTEQERSRGTIEKYIRDVQAFLNFEEQPREETGTLCRKKVIRWKEMLIEKGYAPVTVNSMLSSVNSYLKFLGREDCRVRLLRIQRRMFRDSRRQLSRREYQRLLDAAEKQGRKRQKLLMECMVHTGIRVSEVRYITVEACRRGRTEISLKGKIRTILIQKKLCRKLLQYAEKREIRSGEIFRSRKGQGISRGQIWKEMKSLCRGTGVSPGKVFPHNLRHLFAETFYKISRDLVKLADVLGHSSVETTRIYLLTAEEEHLEQMEKMYLLI